MNRSMRLEEPQRFGNRAARLGLLAAFRLVLLLFAFFAPVRPSFSAPALGEMTELRSRLGAPLISRLNEAMTLLWPKLVRQGEVVEISDSRAEELVDEVLNRLRTAGRTIPTSLRGMLLWNLTSCFSVDGGGLRGINGMFSATSKVLCPNGNTFSCILTALGIPTSVEEQNEAQALEASVLAEAFKHIGHEAAANAASSKGTGVGLEQVRELASEETRISVTDQETQALFTQGIRSQLELQKGFQQFQWLRFDRFHKVSSAFRLAQRLFYQPEVAESSSERTVESAVEGSIGDILELVACVARDACLGINEPGFQRTVEKCSGLVGTPKVWSPLDMFFHSSTTKKQGSLAAQVFATSLLVLQSVKGRRISGSARSDTEGLLEQSVALSPLQQAVETSVAECSSEVMTTLESHLQALGGLETISANPLLYASIILENAPLLFSLNGVPSPKVLSLEYEMLRESGTKFGIAVVRWASRMISTACGKERRCQRPSNSYISCVSKSLENVTWPALRLLLEQHVYALAYFVGAPDILPEGPQFSDALRDFTSAASNISETLRAASILARGALDLRLSRESGSIRLFDALVEFSNQMEDNLLHVGMSFLEDGEFYLYGPAIRERIASTTEETCSQAPPAGDSSTFKSFVIMERLGGHLEQISGNETLRRVYMGTAEKTGLSARAVESTFVRQQARQLFVTIQSHLETPSAEMRKRFSTTEGVQAYITEYLASKVGPGEQEGEESGFGPSKYSGETIALANAVLKELHRIFAKLIVASDAFKQAQRTAGMRVRTWVMGEFSDFRREINASYFIEAAHGCLQQCTGPLLADKRLQTQCTGSQGSPQPLGKCADPAEQFQRIVNKEMWEGFLADWLAQGKAPAACAELVELQEEDSQAWQRQVYLMASHLDTIGCGKDHRGLDSFGRYSIKLEMIQQLYDMFASATKTPTLETFIAWLVKLREPLPKNLQTPTAVALQYASGHPQTQVRVSKAFNIAVKRDPSYSQCRAEDTKIISELIPSLGSVFHTLEAFDSFIKERRAQEESVTRQVTAPLAAKARPILSQMMITYTTTATSYPEAVIRYPAFFPAATVDSLSKLGMKAMRVFAYMQDVLGNMSIARLSSPQNVEHFFNSASITETWTKDSLEICDSTCSLRSEGENGVSITIGAEIAVKPYTFPATAEETLAAGVFGWLLPTFPTLPCKRPNRKVVPVILPVPPPTVPPLPTPSKEAEPEKEPEEEPSPPPPPPPPTATETTTVPPPEQRPEPSEVTEETIIPTPPRRVSTKKVHKKIDVVKTENADAVDPEEMITLIPPKPEGGQKVEKTEDACMLVVRLYEQYIEGSSIKEVDSLLERAMEVPLFKSTRRELGIKESDNSLQKFRLALCVMCAKHIPLLQLATGEAREQLRTSIERSKEACGQVYAKTDWAKEIEGGAPLASPTPNSPVTTSVQLNLQISALSHRLLGGVQPLLQSAEKEAKAIEVCASAEVLGRSLQDAKGLILRKNPEASSPLLLALGGMSRTASRRLRFHKLCSQITAQLAAIFGSPARVGRKRVPPSTMAGGLRNWVSQDVGLKAWATEAHKQLKSDKYVAALCSALRYAEFVRQISMPGMTFDRVLSHWNLSLPSNGLMLVNALRSASNPRQTLTQELCVLTPPGHEVQQLPRRFDQAQWAAMMLQTGEEAEASASESPRASEA